MRKKKAALNKGKDKAAKDDKKDAIQAALARVREKQNKSGVEAKNIENLTAEQQKKIDEIDARRKREENDSTP